MISIRPIAPADQAWVRDFFIQHWGSPQMVYSKGIHECDRLSGFVAADGVEMIGVVTYSLHQDECEIVSLDSLREGQGIGSALMQAVEEAMRQRGVKRIWLITTNDNLHALRFYQKRGYELVRLYPKAVNQARQIKPQIPLIGNDGIPILDELELEKRLDRRPS